MLVERKVGASEVSDFTCALTMRESLPILIAGWFAKSFHVGKELTSPGKILLYLWIAFRYNTYMDDVFTHRDGI